MKKSFYYAFNGIKSAIHSERNLKIHFIIMTLVIIAGILFHISSIEWLICIILFLLVICLEMVNTAIETVVDMAMPKIHPLAKKAKDIAAGAVLIAALGSIVAGSIIFLPKVISLFL